MNDGRWHSQHPNVRRQSHLFRGASEAVAEGADALSAVVWPISRSFLLSILVGARLTQLSRQSPNRFATSLACKPFGRERTASGSQAPRCRLNSSQQHRTPATATVVDTHKGWAWPGRVRTSITRTYGPSGVEQPRRVGLERLLATLQNKTLDGAQEQVHLLEQTPQATLLLSAAQHESLVYRFRQLSTLLNVVRRRDGQPLQEGLCGAAGSESGGQYFCQCLGS